ncbi:MAG: hypothetical protein S4CHLAM102_03780 [Chlamydiia bacterium]|nr:hypothetical protein [Chlamydiia bacterium]
MLINKYSEKAGEKEGIDFLEKEGNEGRTPQDGIEARTAYEEEDAEEEFLDLAIVGERF